MGIPAFAGVDEEHAVPGVFDDIAPVVEVQSEFRSAFGRRWQHDVEVVAAMSVAVLQIHPFILEIGERFTVPSGDRVHVERARQLEDEYALAGNFGTHAQIGFCVQGGVGEDGGIDLVVKRDEVASVAARAPGSA